MSAEVLQPEKTTARGPSAFAAPAHLQPRLATAFAIAALADGLSFLLMWPYRGRCDTD